MTNTKLSRRTFSALAGALALHGEAALSAQDVVQRIQTSLGGEWPSTGPDGLKAGDPNTPVKGIATTAMATLDVLRRAVTAGTNLVVTYEPAFFGRQDLLTGADPVFTAKKQFIEKNGLVIFRLRDHWQARKGDDMTAGLAASLGWTQFRVKPDDALYDIPAATAEDTVGLIRRKLNLQGGLRAVGDRKATVRRVLVYPGPMTSATMWKRYSEADLTVAGEVREWENTHYAADIYTAGEKRGLVTIGRVVSEDPGMRACAEWLKGVVRPVPAQWLPVGDLYWRAV